MDYSLLENIILDTDSYKFSHYLQYPPGMTKMISYIESRGGKWGGVFVFGLQYILERYFTRRVTVKMVEQAAQFAAAHGVPFPYDGWMYIAKNLDGKLPLKIYAVAEGTWVPTGNVITVIESTDEKVPWIVSWMETQLMRVWYPITVATQSLSIKKIIAYYLEKTAPTTEWNLPFRFHDFGSRGVSCQEQAGIGGMAHLAHWMGTDTDIAIPYADLFYYGGAMSGFSIPASEHSSITSWTKQNEYLAYLNMVEKFSGPGKVFACVLDSYNIYNALEELWCNKGLIEKVKKSGGCVVIRPDSGDPREVLPRLLNILSRKLPSEDFSKFGSYKILPQYIRIIQGDGVNEDSVEEILKTLKDQYWSTANITFGSGGANLQKVNRDTCSFAMKCSEILVDNNPVLVYKEPTTDNNKRSKAGRLDLVINPFGEITTIRVNEWLGKNSLLNIAYENGEMVTTYTLKEIREKSDALVLAGR